MKNDGPVTRRTNPRNTVPTSGVAIAASSTRINSDGNAPTPPTSKIAAHAWWTAVAISSSTRCVRALSRTTAPVTLPQQTARAQGVIRAMERGGHAKIDEHDRVHLIPTPEVTPR